MDDVFYDTSLTVYVIPEGSPPLTALLSASDARLKDHARALQDHLLSGRVAYEREEERAKIGGLRACNFAPLQADEDENEPYGVLITLLYDKISYKVILYGNSSPPPKPKNAKQQQADPPTTLPLLLIKASSTLTTRILTFLSTSFTLPVPTPLRLPAHHLPTVLNTYITSLVAAHATIASTHALLTFLRDTVGLLKLSISITHPDAAKSLRTIDIDVPPETLFQLVTSTSPTSTGNTPDFLAALHTHLHARTGLLLPLIAPPGGEANEDEPDPPLKLSRISNAAFALSSEGRVKLSAKAVQAVDAVPGLGSGDENVVRLANRALLEGLVGAALGMGD